ncbi:MAG: 5-formyltetrahydrofolate cyclo-ligase [Acidobacteria bacterium]|nr:5-formyltetrahydrofolate cyclo-ligase [Acidobacteriota bacterium]
MTHLSLPIGSNKATQRRLLRKAREEMLPEFRQRAGVALASHASAWSAETHDVPVLCSYLSVGLEPDTSQLNVALLDAGYRVMVPVCEPGFALSWASWTPGVPLAQSRLAPVREPAGQRIAFAELGPVAGILLPALAADHDGTRLGQGGGYYDRFLASLRHSQDSPPDATRTTAVIYDAEYLPAGILAAEPWDIPVTGVLTPSGLYSTAPR